jgi:Bifunctional DNA primase/polymerase, N-terminal
VTKNERLEQLALATTLGRLCLLWGVVEADGILRCECEKHDCRPGKHPRTKNWKQSATLDPTQILAWLERYPHANFGIVMSEHVIAVDADIRPDEGKHGVAVLDYLEIGAGVRIPSTVTVLSGRNNGSKHQFFTTPDLPPDSLYSPFYGVDLIRRGLVVAPGSRHVSGHFYRFAGESGPVEQEVAAMPDFLLAAFTKKQYPVASSVEAIKPGRRRPDWVVERQVKRDPVAGPLYAGIRTSRKNNGAFDRSRDDFSLCKYLAFYTSHHWDQYCWFFENSGLYGDKTNGDYIERTLENAFLANSANWIETKRKSRATGAKLGRKLAPDTLTVIVLHKSNPNLTAVEIAEQVGCSSAKIRNILHRFRNGHYSSPSHNVDCLHTGGLLGEIWSHKDPDRSNRHDDSNEHAEGVPEGKVQNRKSSICLNTSGYLVVANPNEQEERTILYDPPTRKCDGDRPLYCCG